MKNLGIIMLLCILGSGAADALAGNMHVGAGIGNTFFSSDYQDALGRLQIAIVDIFGKAGVHLGPIGLRLEWESLEGGAYDNLSMVSLGATLGF